MFRLVAFLLIAVALPAQADDTVYAVDYAHELVAQGDLKTAREIFTRVIEAPPRGEPQWIPMMYLARGKTWPVGSARWRTDLDRAATAFEAIRDAEGPTRTAQRQGRAAAAEALLLLGEDASRRLKSAPTEAARTSVFTEATTAFGRAVALDVKPWSGRAWVHLATAQSGQAARLAEQGDLEGAAALRKQVRVLIARPPQSGAGGWPMRRP